MEPIKLIPNEVRMIQMALSSTLEDLEVTSQNPELPFTPDARKDMKEMIQCAKSAIAKMALIMGNEVSIEPYQEGDENQFFTKQS